MNDAACAVLRLLPDVVVAYGVSDEFSFVFHRGTALFERRRDKLVSTVVSTFTAQYVGRWETVMGCGLELDWLPTFDARAVVYPGVAELRDYLSWRQVDCMSCLELCTLAEGRVFLGDVWANGVR